MNILLQVSLSLMAMITIANCHGNLLLPISWLDHEMWTYKGGQMVYGYTGIASRMQCFAGLKLPNKDLCPSLPRGCKFMNPGAVCYWFKNYTKVEKPVLFDPVMRTYAIHDKYSYYDHPWRAPGTAKIDSPCGVAGGNMNGCVGGDCDPMKGGYGFGVGAENFKFPWKIAVTNWTRGDVVEVAWGITANHGGGYSYRLCKEPPEGKRGLTEECFQQTPLDFFGKYQWVQYGEDVSTRQAFLANRTRKNTYPEGSQWTKNPIPACIGNAGGFYNPTADCPEGTQFPPPEPKLFGFGASRFGAFGNFKFSIIDKVIIPKNLKPGKYVLSFRWDCEQTPQVWNTCASVHLD